MTGYVITIKTAPESKYQTYQGWDKVYATRAEAKAALARAKTTFLRAKLTKVEVKDAD